MHASDGRTRASELTTIVPILLRHGAFAWHIMLRCNTCNTHTCVHNILISGMDRPTNQHHGHLRCGAPSADVFKLLQHSA
jgi:hypothetical protein